MTAAIMMRGFNMYAGIDSLLKGTNAFEFQNLVISPKIKNLNFDCKKLDVSGIYHFHAVTL